MDVMKWSECSQEHTAPTIKNHSVTHFNGYLFCYGGYDGRKNHSTLLLYSIAEQRWIRPYVIEQQQPQPQQQPQQQADTVHNNNNNNNNNGNNYMGDPSIVIKGTPPPGRNGHSATLAAEEDDDENGRIIIIGGWLGTGPLAASDMHVLDISAGGKQLRWYQPAMKGTPPGPCNMHSADYVASQREVYVFRGGNGREYLNDLHALNVDTMTWRRVETTGAIPQQRANHSSAILDETGELFIFGGWNGTERLNDIHILDTATSTWTCPRVGGVLPHPRAGMTLTALRGRLFLFGGSGTSPRCFNDLQILDRQEMAWLDVCQVVDNNSNRRRAGGHDNYYDHHHHHHDDTVFRFGGSAAYQADRTATFHGIQEEHGFSFGDDGDSVQRSEQGGMQDGGTNVADMDRQQQLQQLGYSSALSDWRSREMAARPRPLLLGAGHISASPNPNDQDSVPTVLVHGSGPGRRAGHTATAVNRKLFVFGGSCGSDYLNDFFVLDTDPPPHATVTEPTSLQLLERRLRHFFNDEEFSDVTFLVQGQKVYGHKMILSLVSDCFRAMFTTGFRESDAMEIEIPDCSYAAFVAVMEYIYTGSLPPSSKLDRSHHHHNHRRNQHALQVDNDDDRDRTLERVVEMLELADRFILDHLKQQCETLLQPAVNAETVEYLLTVAQKTNAAQLQAVCEHFMRNRD